MVQDTADDTVVVPTENVESDGSQDSSSDADLQTGEETLELAPEAPQDEDREAA